MSLFNDLCDPKRSFGEPFALGLVTALLPSAFLFALTATTAWLLSRYWNWSALIRLANEGVHPTRHGAAGVRLLVLTAGLASAREVSGFAIALGRPAFLALAGIVTTGAYAVAPTIRAHPPRPSPVKRGSQRTRKTGPCFDDFSHKLS